MSVDIVEQDDVRMGHEPEVCCIQINSKLLKMDMVYHSKDLENNFDFPEAPPLSSSPAFDFNIDLPSPSPPPPEPALETSKCIQTYCETLQGSPRYVT